MTDDTDYQIPSYAPQTQDPNWQPPHLRASYKVVIAGVDVSNALDPYVIKISVIDKEGEIDHATIELDDRYGLIKMPEASDTIEISLGWPSEGSFLAFTGNVTDIESYGQKSSGRGMTIVAQAIDMLGGAKAQVRDSIGDGSEAVTLQDAIKKFAPGSFNLSIDPTLGGMTRNFFSANNESFMSLTDRLAKEVGGVAKFSGSNVSITPMNSFSSATGDALFQVNAIAGKNLLAWRIRPMAARGAWQSTSAQHFDPAKAQWIMSQKNVASALLGGSFFGNTQAGFSRQQPSASQDHADQQAGSDASWAERRGYGWIIIDGEPRAKAQGPVSIGGVRDGVDGGYRSTQVEHTYVRGGGFTSRIDVAPSSTAVSVGDQVGT